MFFLMNCLESPARSIADCVVRDPDALHLKLSSYERFSSGLIRGWTNMRGWGKCKDVKVWRRHKKLVHGKCLDYVIMRRVGSTRSFPGRKKAQHQSSTANAQLTVGKRWTTETSRRMLSGCRVVDVSMVASMAHAHGCCFVYRAS